jgi:DNA-binding CsgD family transcriptional regulator
MSEALIDRIYECGFAPAQWPALLADLADLAGARTGFLFLSNGRDIHRWVTSTEQGKVITPLVENGWLARSERWRRFVTSEHAGFMRERDIYCEEELLEDPFYRDILYPRGLGWAAATAVPLPTGDQFIISLEREYVRGPVTNAEITALDELRPHVARSGLLSMRLRLEQARIAADVLAAIGLPALILDAVGTVLAANALIEGLAGFIVWRAFDRVSFKDRNADELLAQNLSHQLGGKNADARSFPVRHPEAGAVMVAHLVPIRLSARDIFQKGAAALILTPMKAPEAPPVELVRLLFDLTPAEARVARLVAAGGTVESIATEGRLSLNTVRTHLRRVLEKTGCRRQADLVAVLGGISLPRH